ncbi:hypothetical protein [Leptospira dzoumogneensis]|uniref:DUF4145 domain-containing protein n=1 Tax=Leptospira dzoumogneensis TaxID=2484904 RepID=A0A4Z1AKC5_9LEPT|nr:hypothetical protein [Leptospira dzoumogneensis]TGN00018.1 hypothetical protein EHR06_07815 [Leptospira dzoumogneensis]
MKSREKIIEEINNLTITAAEIEELIEIENTKFIFAYQTWYSSALKVVELLAPDRYDEFRSYYEIDPNRKTFGYGTYVIQDFIKNIVPAKIANFDFILRTKNNFNNQHAILLSIKKRANSIIDNINLALLSELQDEELENARKILLVSPRAAGALAGVIIEYHLQKVTEKNNIEIKKKNPTISDLNDPLKNQGIYDTASWRKISYLADIRNLCSHKKEIEPTKEQVGELIDGANWLIKNIQ